MTTEAPRDRERPDEHFEEGEEAPPPGVHTMAVVRWVLLILMALAAAAAVYSYARPLFGKSEVEQTAPKYHCPMHPEITSDVPGECPICHMTLEPIAEERKALPREHVHPPPAPTASASGLLPPHGGGAPGPLPDQQSAPPGTTPITLAFDRTQAIGVRTAAVERRSGEGALRVTAVVQVPDEGRAEVHARADGFVEAIRVKELGVKVKRGELLASLYSPEVFQAQQELLAMSAWPKDGSASPPIDAARLRLELLGFGKAGVDRVLAGKKPIRAVGISSPIAGYVVAKNVVLGSHVTPETTLFEIVDLARVYVIASVYPQQLPAIRVGDRASFRSASLGERVFEAEVDLVYPEVDLATRTARVRFRVKNPELALRPGLFGVAELPAAKLAELTVPLDAVVDTGKTAYVFVAHEGGLYEPRTVELGAQIDERVAVLSGLREGERVVSGATFLVDAESRIQASFAPAPEAGAAPAAAGTCEGDFDRGKFPDKYGACKKCELHRGMGTMEQDCRNAIAKPWR